MLDFKGVWGNKGVVHGRVMSPITFLVYFIEGKSNYDDQSNEPSFHS